MIVVTVMYPNTEGSKFDLAYYTESHLPLVQQRWSSMGMQDVRVSKGIAGGGRGVPAPYQIIAEMTFDSMDSLQKAQGAHGAEIGGDVANFTDVTPVMQIGETVG